MANYSLWMLEYAHCPTQPVSSIIYSQHNQGERLLTFTYLVLKSDDHVAMVDVGYDYRSTNKLKADRFGVVDWQPPDKVLAKIGLKPTDVDTVFLTHAHFDHMGAVNDFPNAHFYIQKKELDDWHKVLDWGEKFSFLAAALDPTDLNIADQLVKNGRMTLLRGYVENILPGIHVLPVFDSHTYGSQIIIIDNDIDGSKKDRWVVSGDNCYAYENLLGINNDGVYLPVGFGVGSQENMIVALDKMMELTNGNVDRIIIGHEPKTWEHFPSWKASDGLFACELYLVPGKKSQIN
jgi:glyoxylase-like metal-dependent hydrolase (beta-lactamase superfamily II)